MIQYVIDNLDLHVDDRVYIIYYKMDERYLSSITHPRVQFINIHKQTEGCVETVYLGLDRILNVHSNHTKCVVMDCDTFYAVNVLDQLRHCSDNVLFYTIQQDQSTSYSYLEIGDNNRITQIREKERISDFANTGIYGFLDIYTLYEYARQVLDHNIRFKGEYYMSCIVDRMLTDRQPFRAIELDHHHVFPLGTPTQVGAFLDRTYLFLFDLDGTLVLTDSIYFKVWKQILRTYRIELTMELFKTTIQGNNDRIALSKLIPTIYEQEVDKVSKLKDELFFEFIDDIQFVEGALEFIQKVYAQRHKIAIVTNCNRKTAYDILAYLNIAQYVDLVVIGNECARPKPYPDPYMTAIRYFQSTAPRVRVPNV